MKIIAAMAMNRVIGAADSIPWNLPDEQAHYRNIIADQTVVMGRRSFELFRHDLTSRHAVVVSRSIHSLPGAHVCESLPAALDLAASLGRDVFVNGGASIYEQAVPLAGEMDLSVIKGQFSGDAYFPAFEEADWELVEQTNHPAWEFRRYRRRK